MKWIRRYIKPISASLLLLFISEVMQPTAVWAITGHENMPEYRSFEPVATTNMVNMFDGSFTYNIPLMSVPNGYPITLSYHSNDVNNEAMASWVGLGWNINPGAINRMKRGFPDEFDGTQQVKYHNRMPANWTIGATVAPANLEIFGSESLTKLNLSQTVTYNNYNGLSMSYGLGLGFAGVANVDLSVTNGKFGFSPSVQPQITLNAGKKKFLQKTEFSTSYQALSIIEKEVMDAIIDYKPGQGKEVSKLTKLATAGNRGKLTGTNFGGGFSIAKSPQAYPVNMTKQTGTLMALKLDLGINLYPAPLKVEGMVTGSFTRQKNDASQTHKVFGYMHSDLVGNEEEAMMDYFSGNERVFEKREKVIGYPMPNNDVYSVSGEALGGSFRAFRSDFGHYRKNKIKSESFSGNTGADYGITSVWVPIINAMHTTTTIGAELGAGYAFSKVKDWNDMASSGDLQFNSDAGEKYFFRFAGDKAGYFDQNDNWKFAPYEPRDYAIRADIEYTLGLAGKPNLDHWNPDVINNSSNPEPIATYQNLPGREYGKSGEAIKQKKRSSFIQHHLNEDFNHKTSVNGESIRHKVYEKDLKLIYDNGTAQVVETYDHEEAANYNPKGIGEIVSWNNDGMTYVYGLPVYARSEKQLQYDFPGGKNLSSGYVQGDPIAEVSIGSQDWDKDASRKLGYETGLAATGQKNEFATTHLITQILSPDYIDRSGNGPTQDDFGAYTRFNYQRITGTGKSSNSWYGYRSPYTGVNMNMGSLSDRKDDMGSFSYGEKEVYYSHSVVSKTHVAIFTLEDRDDAQSSLVGNNPDANDLIEGDDGDINTGSMPLKRLKRIDLYSLKECESFDAGGDDIGVWKPKTDAVPIQTVHFEYDYSLCEDLPNNANYSPGGANGDGKLTLKKVWFEYGGKVRSKISPYVFDYNYPVTGEDYPAPYSSDPVNDYVGLYSSLDQNPVYEPMNTDRWGNYRMFDDLTPPLNNLSKFWPFVHQDPSGSFDPAAYCLKQIELPSGGEIHVQYEQRDYHYIQGEVAQMMVPLKDLSSSNDNQEDETNSNLDNKKYYLDLDKVNIDVSVLTTAEKEELTKQLFAPMIRNQKRMYFNFLYALVGDEVDYTRTSSDYIEGYARIRSYGADPSGVYFTFKGVPGGATVVGYEGKTSIWELPKKVCLEFFRNTRKLKIDGGKSVNKLDKEGKKDGISGKKIANAFTTIIDRIKDGVSGNCKMMDPAMSFVRIQVPAGDYRYDATELTSSYYSKLGGGVRVKRLLMYDDAQHDGAAQSGMTEALYGNEYTYVTRDEDGQVISSGVAANEPSIGRRENALVNPIPKDPQKGLNALLYGRDMYGQEGPLGEDLLPGPSVGYSRVVVNSIHKGMTGTGQEVHEFYTVHDKPFKAVKTKVRQDRMKPVGFGINVEETGINYKRETPYLTQGYTFKTYSMHGQPKRVSKWARGSDPYGSNSVPIAMESYEYFEDGDKVKLIGDDLLEYPEVPYEYLGKESEILAEARQVEDYQFDVKVTKDNTVGSITFLAPPPITFPAIYHTQKSGIGSSISEKILRTHVTTKIITYPAMVKKRITLADGVRTTSENIAFDNNTGEPVVVRSYDDFNGSYLTQSFMAPWEYGNLMGKYKNDGLKIYPTGSGNGLEFSLDGTSGKYYLTFTGATGDNCNKLDDFTVGDFIEIVDNTPSNSGVPGNGTNRILAHVNNLDYVNIRLELALSQHCNAATMSALALQSAAYTNIGTVVIHRSGRKNQLSTKMGQVVYFSPDNSADYLSQLQMTNFNDAFATALNGALAISGNATPTLAGPFYNMDMSHYAAAVSAACPTANASNVTVQDVELDITINPITGNMTIKLESFQLDCGGWLNMICM